MIELTDENFQIRKRHVETILNVELFGAINFTLFKRGSGDHLLWNLASFEKSYVKIEHFGAARKKALKRTFEELLTHPAMKREIFTRIFNERH